jgi:predicted phosphoadenosine phosphosulfate sulfurtransferase
MKLQTSNAKLQRNLKPQTSKQSRRARRWAHLELEDWCFSEVWSLNFEVSPA